MSNRKSLVTGAGGFIGSHLVSRLLQRGEQVHCLYSPRWRSKKIPVREGCQDFFCDVTDEVAVGEACDGVDVVYHLAAKTRDQNGDMMTVNRDGTRAVLSAAAAQSKPPTIVMVSSLAAAGPEKNGKTPVESDVPRPVSKYGHSKLAAETVCREFADRLPISILRPPIVFGPDDPNSFLLFRPVAKRGIHVIPGYRKPTCSLIYSEDLIEAMIQVSESGRRIQACDVGEPGYEQGVYFVAHEPVVGYAELGQLIANSLGRNRVMILPTPCWMIRVAGLAGQVVGKLTGQLPFMNKDKAREVTAGYWTCDSSAIRRDIGFQPGHSLKERIEQTANWYFENGWLKTPVQKPIAGPAFSGRDQRDLADG